MYDPWAWTKGEEDNAGAGDAGKRGIKGRKKMGQL